MSRLTKLIVVAVLAAVFTVAQVATASNWWGPLETNWGSWTTKDSKYTITVLDPSYTAGVAGTLAAWHVDCQRTGQIKLQVFRPVTGGYQLIESNLETLGAIGINNFTVAPADQRQILPSDILGFRYLGDSSCGLIGSNNQGGGSAKFTVQPTGGGSYNWAIQPDIAEGAVVPSSAFGYDLPLTRTYAIAAEITPSTGTLPEPASLFGLVAGLAGLVWRRKR